MYTFWKCLINQHFLVFNFPANPQSADAYKVRMLRYGSRSVSAVIGGNEGGGLLHSYSVDFGGRVEKVLLPRSRENVRFYRGRSSSVF